MFCSDSFQTITQFVGPEDHTMDKSKEPSMSGNLDVLKQYNVSTKFSIICYCICVIKWCSIIFVILIKVYFKIKFKLCVPQELTGINWLTRLVS